jgi:fucose 4-O-acetylase-like acetyltransferase
MAKRIEYIDIAKAICIILVVVGHFCPEYAPSWYESIHDTIYSFHMPLFMFASGLVYIATKKEVTYREFLTKKIKRLMIPYFSTSVIVITVKLLTQGNAYVENPVTLWSYLKMFYLPEAGYFLWFIWALWWMFVLIPLFKTKVSRLALFAASAVLHYVDMPLPREFCIYEFHVMLFFFMLGIVVYEWKPLYTRLSQPSVAFTVIATILFVAIAGNIATHGTLLIRGGM